VTGLNPVTGSSGLSFDRIDPVSGLTGYRIYPVTGFDPVFFYRMVWS
jgi:hypothetical protein